jgi:hypothetical protein
LLESHSALGAALVAAFLSPPSGTGWGSGSTGRAAGILEPATLPGREPSNLLGRDPRLAGPQPDAQGPEAVAEAALMVAVQPPKAFVEEIVLAPTPGVL